jgi:CIC family chloride channel protein
LKLRRSDMRIMVGAGAAGAIAAAFNAPLTGAFYGFELIIGAYSITSLTPVVASALVASLTSDMLLGDHLIIDVGAFAAVQAGDYPSAILLGVVCAAAGIALMQGVALIEGLSHRSFVPAALRPALGGLCVGLLALASPQVLSAGHGALHVNLSQAMPLGALLAIILMKSLASAISIGSGFRGGLFFAALFLGALVGKAYALLAVTLFPSTALTPIVYAIVGMSALTTAIIGGPMTMTFLALELTGDFPITALVLAATMTTALTVRSTFGYSFATWRFHLRGESIKSAHDVGWIRDLTVGRMMRSDVKTALVSISPADFMAAYPLGSTQRAIIVDEQGRYAGIILVPDVHMKEVLAASEDGIGKFLRNQDIFLLPALNAKQAAERFDSTATEELAVLDNASDRRVIGLLTESHTLRRYNEELDRRRQEAYGEV